MSRGPVTRRGLLGRAALVGAISLGALSAAPIMPNARAEKPLIGPSSTADPSLVNPPPPGFVPGSALVRAHAHNDYLHPRPLWDALAAGFGSVEADVWYREGRLLLGHTRVETLSARTLEQWYIQPLAALVRESGRALTDLEQPFQLLIDVKEEGAATLLAIEEMLQGYRDILCRVEDGRAVDGAIQVVYTGNRPFSVISTAPVRFGTMDGHDGDVPTAPDPARMPLVSESWSMLGWQGFGSMPADQEERLERFVANVHASGARARFWGAPELFPGRRPVIWDAQLNAGVDLIGTDHLQHLREHLLARGL